MSTDLKNYAKTVLQGYNDTVSRLYSRYNNLVQNIDNVYDQKSKAIEKNRKDSINSANVYSDISLKNTKAELLDKGLSKSGESAQANIDNNITRNNAFSAIDKSAAEDQSENEAARAHAKNDALMNLYTDLSKAEESYAERYIDQLNADRKYEADRDDENYYRNKTDREYEADREDEEYYRYKTDREYEADRDDENYFRYREQRNYEADRDDEAYDRAYDAKYLDLKTPKAEATSSKKDEDTEESTEESTETKAVEVDGITLESTPREVVSLIVSSVNEKYKPGSEIAKNTISKTIRKIVNDPQVNYEYRYQIKLYAKALGYY